MTQSVSPIAVVGSVNLDQVATVETLPDPGETVLALGYREFSGGKGGNQAIAAARLGQAVSIVGVTGDDAAGDFVRRSLLAEGVDVTQLQALSDAPTGRALVVVDEAAENSIVVVGGANAHLSPRHIDGAADLLRAAAVVVAQLEIRPETVLAAARHARGLFILNAAPARHLDSELIALVDVLVVNEGEFEVVAGFPATADPSTAARLSASAVRGSVVITLGADGALVWSEGRLTAVLAPTVTVVDTTGAGDTFVGALADALARGQPLLDAAHWAVHAASLSTASLGATTAMPTRDQVLQSLSTNPVDPQPPVHEQAPMS